MARLLPFVLFFLSFGLVCVASLRVILGDPVTFPEIKNCPPDEKFEIYRADRTSPVAVREHGVWTPAKDYQDRMTQNQNQSFGFSRTVYTDTGLYESRCGSRERQMWFQLEVLRAEHLSVTEGEQVLLPCYLHTGDVDFVRWEKDQHMVLGKDLSSGHIRPGPGFEDRVSLPPYGDEHGDWSLFFHHIQPEDQGDYFCSARKNGVREARGDPAAVRVLVIKRKPDQTTLRPPTSEEKAEGRWTTVTTVIITAVVTSVIVGPVSILLDRYLKSRSTRVPPGPAVRRDLEVSLSLLNTNHPPPPPHQPNGLNSSQSNV